MPPSVCKCVLCSQTLIFVLATRYAGAQGLVAILSELLLVIYVVVLTVMAVMKIVKTRGS